MAIEVDTFVERIDLTQESDVAQAIKSICDNQRRVTNLGVWRQLSNCSSR